LNLIVQQIHNYSTRLALLVRYCVRGFLSGTVLTILSFHSDPLQGRVIVDGHDVSGLNVESYRRSIALVSQEPTLYDGTLGFNIRLGAFVPPEQVTQQEVEEAAKASNIHTFIMSLPDGYETQVGGKGAVSRPFLLPLFLPADTLFSLVGAQLSGGQKRALKLPLLRHFLKLMFSSI
jgi:ABC-type transport system involved in Fe-S cluster assembly fused permease/ATPase subunit